MDRNNLPYEYQPLSPWAYFGWSLVFNIPIIGLVALIILSFSDSNINRRNYARSYFCVLAIALIVVLIFVLTGGIGALGVFLTNLVKQ